MVEISEPGRDAFILANPTRSLQVSDSATPSKSTDEVANLSLAIYAKCSNCYEFDKLTYNCQCYKVNYCSSECQAADLRFHEEKC